MKKTCHCNCSCGTVSIYPCEEGCGCCSRACKQKCGDSAPPQRGADNRVWANQSGEYHPCQHGGKCHCGGKYKGGCSNKYSNAGGFLGTGVTSLKIISWSLAALAILYVVNKGLEIRNRNK